MADRLRRDRASLEKFERDGEKRGAFEERSSGVRKALPPELRDDDDDAASEAPTLPPRALTRTRSETLAPVHELLYRFDVGDHRGALKAAEALLDRSLVPSIVVPHHTLSSHALDTHGALLLSCIDGRSTLEAVLERSALPLLDALRALCDLLDAKLVALR